MIPFEWLQKNWVFARAARICVPSPGISGRAFRFRSPYAGQPGDRQRFIFGRRAVSVSRVGSGQDLEFSYLVPPRNRTRRSGRSTALDAQLSVSSMPQRSLAHARPIRSRDLGPRFTCATPSAKADDARSTSCRTTKEAAGSHSIDGWRGQRRVSWRSAYETSPRT
jgi:hypothetical protein